MSLQESTLVNIDYQDTVLIATLTLPKLRDLSVSNEIKQALLSAIAQHKPTSVVIDLRHVEFIASIGFLAFLAVRRESGVERIALCEFRENVKEVFLLCRLISDTNDPKVPFLSYATLPNALSAMKES